MSTRTARDIHALVPDSPPITDPHPWPARAPIGAGDGIAADDRDATAPPTGAGLQPPFTFVSRTYYEEDVPDTNGDLITQQVDLFISYTDANGLAFDLPSGRVAPGGATVLTDP